MQLQHTDAVASWESEYEQNQKLYGDVYLDSHKSYSGLSTDSDGLVTELDLSGYIPYTGETGDVDLGAHDLETTGIATIGPGALIIGETLGRALTAGIGFDNAGAVTGTLLPLIRK